MNENPSQEGGKTALVVIDVQAGLFKQAKGIYQAEQLLDNLNDLIDEARWVGVPVIFIQHENERNLKRGSAGWYLHPQIRPLKTEKVIHKQQGNAFKKTSLQEELANLGVDTVLICGLVTHGCVRATCLGAMQLGYRTILVSDGHSSYSKDAAKLIEKWNAALAEKGAELKETSEVVEWLG